jgi:hypothetical protein
MSTSIKVVVKTHKIIVSQKGTQGSPGNTNTYDPGDLAALFSSI